jgi:hypothetical protein
MTSESRESLLKLALTAFGVVFILIYPLGMLWPSGWVWHGGQGQYYLQMICGVYAVLGAFLMRRHATPRRIGASSCSRSGRPSFMRPSWRPRLCVTAMK